MLEQDWTRLVRSGDGDGEGGGGGLAVWSGAETPQSRGRSVIMIGHGVEM